MILVTVGTQKQQFNRLFELIEKCDYLKDEKIIAQVGYTKYNNEKIKCFDFISLDKMNKYISQSDIVITHGGVGTIFSALKQGKKVIAVPRLAKYDEHINDHQIEVCEELEKEGYILYYKDGVDTLEELIKKVNDIELKKYETEDKKYIDILRKEI